MKASDLLVKAIENESIDGIFGVPGKENLDVVESLRHCRPVSAPTVPTMVREAFRIADVPLSRPATCFTDRRR